MVTNTFITEDGKYHVESLGNGWAYSITCQRTGNNFFVQDHNAEQLNQECDDFRCTSVLDQYMEALGGAA
jgi:hypothetical protein